MPTKEPRLNVVLDKETRDLIAHIAAQRETTSSKIAADLINEALDMAEDQYWSELAEERRKDTRPPLSHDEFWALARKKIKK